ncbi:MAG: SDR family oxidoreductase, partial [Bacteroidota bacterium]
MAKQALIVGGTTGMGKATAQLLLQDGIEVIIIGRPDKQINETIETLSPLGEIKGVGLDLFDEAAVSKFTQSLATNYPNLQYLVNAAGYFSPKPFLEHEGEDYDLYHRFNRAFFFITQAASRIFQANGGGSIVNIGSMWAKQAIK